MARYNQKRKRSVGTYGTVKRRRIMKRRRRTQRVNAFGVSGEGTVVRPSKISRHRTSKRKYRNALYTFSNLFPKFVYLAHTFTSRSTPTNVTQYQFDAVECLPTLFDQTKYTSMDSSNTPTDANFTPIVRGGVVTLTLATEAQENLDYKVQLVWIKKGGNVIANGTYFKEVWPLNVTVNKGNETTVIMKEWSGTTLSTQGVVKFQYRPRIKMYKKEWYAASNDEMYWYVYVGNTVDQAAAAYEIVNYASCTTALLNEKM